MSSTSSSSSLAELRRESCCSCFLCVGGIGYFQHSACKVRTSSLYMFISSPSAICVVFAETERGTVVACVFSALMVLVACAVIAVSSACSGMGSWTAAAIRLGSFQSKNRCPLQLEFFGNVLRLVANPSVFVHSLHGVSFTLGRRLGIVFIIKNIWLLIAGSIFGCHKNERVYLCKSRLYIRCLFVAPSLVIITIEWNLLIGAEENIACFSLITFVATIEVVFLFDVLWLCLRNLSF